MSTFHYKDPRYRSKRERLAEEGFQMQGEAEARARERKGKFPRKFGRHRALLQPAPPVTVIALLLLAFQLFSVSAFSATVVGNTFDIFGVAIQTNLTFIPDRRTPLSITTGVLSTAPRTITNNADGSFSVNLQRGGYILQIGSAINDRLHFTVSSTNGTYSLASLIDEDIVFGYEFDPASVSYELNTAADATLVNVTNNQIIVWDSATERWTNRNLRITPGTNVTSISTNNGTEFTINVSGGTSGTNFGQIVVSNPPTLLTNVPRLQELLHTSNNLHAATLRGRGDAFLSFANFTNGPAYSTLTNMRPQGGLYTIDVSGVTATSVGVTNGFLYLNPSTNGTTDAVYARLVSTNGQPFYRVGIEFKFESTGGSAADEAIVFGIGKVPDGARWGHFVISRASGRVSLQFSTNAVPGLTQVSDPYWLYNSGATNYIIEVEYNPADASVSAYINGQSASANYADTTLVHTWTNSLLTNVFGVEGGESSIFAEVIDGADSGLAANRGAIKEFWGSHDLPKSRLLGGYKNLVTETLRTDSSTNSRTFTTGGVIVLSNGVVRGNFNVDSNLFAAGVNAGTLVVSNGGTFSGVLQGSGLSTITNASVVSATNMNLLGGVVNGPSFVDIRVANVLKQSVQGANTFFSVNVSPSANLSFDLGAGNLQWRTVYGSNYFASGSGTFSNTVNLADISIPITAVTGQSRLYSTNGELWAVDAGGTHTQQTRDNWDGPAALYDGDTNLWPYVTAAYNEHTGVFRWKNENTGVLAFETLEDFTARTGKSMPFRTWAQRMNEEQAAYDAARAEEIVRRNTPITNVIQIGSIPQINAPDVPVFATNIIAINTNINVRPALDVKLPEPDRIKRVREDREKKGKGKLR